MITGYPRRIRKLILCLLMMLMIRELWTSILLLRSLVIVDALLECSMPVNDIYIHEDDISDPLHV